MRFQKDVLQIDCESEIARAIDFLNEQVIKFIKTNFFLPDSLDSLQDNDSFLENGFDRGSGASHVH